MDSVTIWKGVDVFPSRSVPRPLIISRVLSLITDISKAPGTALLSAYVARNDMAYT